MCLILFHGASCTSQTQSSAPVWVDAVTGAAQITKQWSSWASTFDFKPWTVNRNPASDHVMMTSLDTPPPPAQVAPLNRNPRLGMEISCSGIGKIGFALQERDSCVGEQCTAEEAQCGVVTVQAPDFEEHTASIAQECEITKVTTEWHDFTLTLCLEIE